MKGKFVSALVGLSAAAAIAVPGAASASTAHQTAPARATWGWNNCQWRPVPFWALGRYHWVQEGWGWRSRCVLEPNWGGGGGGGGWGSGGGGGGGGGWDNGHSREHGVEVKVSL